MISVNKLNDINWNQVYYFYEVARKMSMKDAAEVTGVSIPTVSEQIKRLETLLGVMLFHRRPRRIELTSDGELLYRHAQGMFESGRRFLDAVSPTSIGGYPVRVGLQESFAESFANDFLVRYAESYAPFGVVSTVRENSSDRAIERLHEGSIDWAIVIGEPYSKGLERGRIGVCEVAFMASRTALAKFPLETDAFKELPLARCRQDEFLNRTVSDRLQAAGVLVEEIVESEHPEFCKRLVESDQCIAAFPKAFASEASQLRAFSVGGPMFVVFSAVWKPSSGRMVAIRRLIHLLESDTQSGRSGLSLPTTAGESTPIVLPHSFRHVRLDSSSV